ncbi:hypothetical protein BD289DRAFT_158143 [Coniella lustricola]|uniref:Uncharacterized protein n=1 Tax=Coniella lustricola TaxID=2025994 RepID=A0A2T3AMR3_9PEZI|nr:hypothetical protein BD289DRAFT_158143 [Coniella lustricola]
MAVVSIGILLSGCSIYCTLFIIFILWSLWFAVLTCWPFFSSFSSFFLAVAFAVAMQKLIGSLHETIQIEEARATQSY